MSLTGGGRGTGGRVLKRGIILLLAGRTCPVSTSSGNRHQSAGDRLRPETRGPWTVRDERMEPSLGPRRLSLAWERRWAEPTLPLSPRRCAVGVSVVKILSGCSVSPDAARG